MNDQPDIAHAHQAELQCDSCGGQCIFDPREAGLKCESCGSVHSLETPEDHKAREEFDYRSNFPKPDVHRGCPF